MQDNVGNPKQNGDISVAERGKTERKRKMLPEGCGYQGYEFGASYPDSICFGGRLYDADNCDGKGNYFEPEESIPCPMCHPRKATEYWAEQNIIGGADELDARAAAHSLVQDIRNNRKNGTEPWKGAVTQ